MVLGMAATAMPFARSPEDQAERWLRILRLHGDAGTALQALGVSEGPLEASHHDTDGQAPAEAHGAPLEAGADVIAAVTEDAIAVASRRGAHALGTTDVLLAVMQVYGRNFDQVLRVHGTDREEVLERLGPETAGASGC
jgi:phage-related minor tail protein